MYLLTSIICMGLGSFVMGKFSAMAHDPRNKGAIDLEEMPRFIASIIERPMLYVLLCLPALGCGIMLLAGARPRTLWNVLGLLASLMMIGTLFASIIYWLAPLYQYQPL